MQSSSIHVSTSRFALVNAGIVYMYCTSFQKVDEEEYGGAWELTKEGFMTSFAGFLVSCFESNIFHDIFKIMFMK